MPTRIAITHPGSLSELGYSLNAKDVSRRRALARAVKKRGIGYQKTMQKVNALEVFNKNKRKSLANVASSDKKWLKSKFGCGCASPEPASMGFGGEMKIKVGSMKLIVNTNLGTLYRATDNKYLGRIRRTEKGVYFTNNGKRVYLPDRVAKVLGKGKGRKSKRAPRKKSRARKSKRRSRRRKARKSKGKSKRRSRRRKARKSKRKSKRRARKSKRRARKSKRRARKSKRKSKRRSRRRKARKSKSKSKRRVRKSKRRVRKSKRRARKYSKKNMGPALNAAIARKGKKSSGGCSRQYTKKYASRPGPPYPANKCCGQTMVGNDGRTYESVPNKTGICTWKVAK